MNDRFEHLVKGVCPVIESPFSFDGSIDPYSFDSIIDSVLSTGVTAALWPAFASEFYKLSDDEKNSMRTQFLQRTETAGDFIAIVGITQHSTQLAVDEARRAADQGASALNVLPPYFLAPSKGAVLEHLSVVIEAVNPLPIVIQHAPNLAASRLGPEDFTYLANRYENLRLIKVESVPPGSFIQALNRGEPKLPAMVGYAGIMMIDALRRGAVGVQPGCSFIELYQAIWEFWSVSDFESAEALHRRLLPYISYWMQEMELIIQVEKTISKERGIVASDHCRQPSRSLDAEEKLSIARFLTEFEEYFQSS